MSAPTPPAGGNSGDAGNGDRAGGELGIGALRFALDGADVRNLSVGGERVLTRLYIAVRDERWNTIPFSCSAPDVRHDGDRLQVSMTCAVDAAPIRAEWEVRIAAGGSLFEYAISGRMLSSFRYAKLGLNLHHPLPESLGARYVARRGPLSASGRVPALIEPQFFRDGTLTAMFMPYDELVLQSAADDEIVFSFSGDEFEMQDHRNWTDYNLKSYGTPLEVPLPLVAEPGQRIEQSVRIDVRRARGAAAGGGSPDRTAELVVRRDVLGQLPRLGSELADEIDDPGEAAGELAATLGLDYLRVNLDLTDDAGPRAAADRARWAAARNLPLELVLVVSPGGVRHDEVLRLERWLAEVAPRLERLVVLEGPRGFVIGRTASPGETVRAYRVTVEHACGPTRLVSATEQFFAELNRDWPELAGVDGVGYTICPQVHAADDTSLMENSLGQADTVATARARSQGCAVHITSVAMIGKFGPYPGGVPDVPLLSAYGDERQHELFGAAWTLSSLRQLADAETASATYFELAGERGLIRLLSGSSTGARAPGPAARPGPVYRLLETVCAWRGGNLVRLGAGGELAVTGLGMEWAERGEFLLANLSPAARHVRVAGLPGPVVEASELRNPPSPHGAAFEPAPAAHPGRDNAAPGELAVELPGYGVLRLRTA